MMVAVEMSLAMDEASEFERQRSIVGEMSRALSALPGVTTEIAVPVGEAQEPYVEVRWDATQYPVSVADLKQSLRDGDPSVEVRALFLSDGQLSFDGNHAQARRVGHRRPARPRDS